ncbi:hydantoinase B/oxoprolinase family protein [Actinophytocola sp.]|uniref:hydantoinase B/oxoprolinase family protein n=1 Tax=Actinophytocola sp. TaxID=1872138 RepID=UPI003D6ADBB0
MGSAGPAGGASEPDPVQLEISWARLMSIVDESAIVLRRTSFSTVVRESNDFACALVAPDGTTLAENSTGVPSFAGVMGRVMRTALTRIPLENWRDGDLIIHNDPWTNTGHTPDTTLISPIFMDGRLMAFALNAAHKSDIGGRGATVEAKDTYEEGLRFDFCQLAKEGEDIASVYDIIRANVRMPDTFLGDLQAQISAAKVCGQRLVDFLRYQSLGDLGVLGRAIQERSEAVMRNKIAALPDGEYTHAVVADGFDEPLTIQATVRVTGSDIEIDFDGTSPQVKAGVNTVFNYAYAFACYTVKCVLDPVTPKNEGSYAPITVRIPEGCILNAKFPAPVMVRSMSGHFVAAAALGALAQVVPDDVIADSGSCPGLRATISGIDRNGKRFGQLLFPNGGMGAGARADGHSCTGFPTNAGGEAVEVTESIAPVLFWERQYLPDSGGPGAQRGGLGQRVVIEYLGAELATLLTRFDRVDHPAQGLLGGLPGRPAALHLNDVPIPSKGRMEVRQGDVLRLDYAGGGGYGDPTTRDPALIEQDVAEGLVSATAAAQYYGYRGGETA